METNADCVKITNYYNQQLQQEAIRLGGVATSGRQAQIEMLKQQEVDLTGLNQSSF
jgi:hypothetical protein